jgi:hypothetical protein
MCCSPAGQLAGFSTGGTLICTLTVQGHGALFMLVCRLFEAALALQCLNTPLVLFPLSTLCCSGFCSVHA